MVTIAPNAVVAVELEVVVTTLPGATKEPGNTLMMPARPSIGARM